MENFSSRFMILTKKKTCSKIREKQNKCSCFRNGEIEQTDNIKRELCEWDDNSGINDFEAETGDFIRRGEI